MTTTDKCLKTKAAPQLHTYLKDIVKESYMDRSKVLPTEWVKLNVGGKIFYTSMATLLKGDTMLSRMFSSEIPKPLDENGAVLIDRNGKHFNKILDFLRNGIGPVLETGREVKELKLEAEFYLVRELKEYCESYKVMVYKSQGKWAYDNFKIDHIVYDVYGWSTAPEFSKLGEHGTWIPLMPDGTMSVPYLCNSLGMSGPSICNENAVPWPPAANRYTLDPMKYRSINWGIFVMYWKSSNGKPEEKELVIKENKVLPPQYGWHALPEWAFDGPYYFVHNSTNHMIGV